MMRDKDPARSKRVPDAMMKMSSLQSGLGEDEAAAILIFGLPPSVFVTNSTITDSAAYGIGRSWNGAPLDFLPTNSFAQIGKCKESYPRQTGACPTPVPCP